MLQAAMLADAADSSLLLTRSMDTELIDPALLTSEIKVYLNTIIALFCGGKCFETFGYTMCMLDLLKEPLFFQVGRTTRSLGSANGVSILSQTRCMDRMRSWVGLAKAALDA